MTRTEIVPKLTSVFHDVFDDESIVLRDDMTARDVLEWDSLSNIRLMVSIEEAFGFTFDTGQISELKNVGQLIEAIIRHTS
jgi:acyl carrier protein